MNRQRIMTLDIARVLCIILVVIGHFAPDNAPAGYIVFRQWIYAFHMPVFLFVSGFVYQLFHNDNEPYSAFVQKKFRRLIIPYIITSFIVIAIKLLTQSAMTVENPVSAASFLYLFCRPEAGYFLWFIWTLFTLFLIIPWFKTSRQRLVLFFLAFVIHYYMVFMFGQVSVPELFAVDKTLWMLLWFMSGVVTAEYRDSMTHYLRFRPLILLLFVGCSAWFAYDPAYDEQTLPAALLPYLGILSILFLSNDIERHHAGWHRWLLPLSQASFFIYLFHTTCMGVAKSLCGKITFFATDTGFYLQLVCVVAVGVIVPLLIYRLLISFFPFTKKYI